MIYNSLKSARSCFFFIVHYFLTFEVSLLFSRYTAHYATPKLFSKTF